MNLAQRFYNLLSGLESGNMGPEMYVRPSGPGDYGKTRITTRPAARKRCGGAARRW